MRKLLKKRGFAPKLLVTGELRSYASAFRRLRLTCPHERGLRKNNRAETRIRRWDDESGRPSPLPQMHSEQGRWYVWKGGVRQRAGRIPRCAPRCFPAAARREAADCRTK